LIFSRVYTVEAFGHAWLETYETTDVDADVTNVVGTSNIG